MKNYYLPFLIPLLITNLFGETITVSGKVVDKKNKLLGTLSDGDARRNVLKKSNIKKSVFKFCNKKPIYVNQSNYSISKVKKLFRVSIPFEFAFELISLAGSTPKTLTPFSLKKDKSVPSLEPMSITNNFLFCR